MVRLANLQAPLVRRSAKPLYAVLLLGLREAAGAAGAAGFLRGLLPLVASGDAPEVVGTPTASVFLSWRAVSALAGGHPHLDPAVGRRQFEASFTDPMQAPDSAAMAGQLGFTGSSAPLGWWADFATSDIDLAVFLGCDTDGERRELLGKLRADVERAGLRELQVPGFPRGTVEGYRPEGGVLHFGYRDGITTPRVDWDDGGAADAENFREFLLGYPTADYPTAPHPDGPWRDFARDGSFACLTWIQQDVAGFEAFLSEHAARIASPHGSDPVEWLAAQLMGRWRDGSPLVRHPDVPPASPDLDDDFGYAADPEGARCPLDAHVRVAYSRDQPLGFPNARRFPKGPPRLIRRGFTYGAPLTTGGDDGQDRGLFGIFLCARVNEQFYSVLRWMQQTDFSDVFDRAEPGRSGQDRVTGTRLPGGGNRTPDATIALPGAASPAKVSLKPFIRYRGVVPLFVPSVDALRMLAAGHGAPVPRTAERTGRSDVDPGGDREPSPGDRPA